MREAEPLCAENIGLKDITRSRRGERISRGELIMYYSLFVKWFSKVAFEGGRRKQLQEFIESSMRLLEQARSHVAIAVNDSKSTPLEEQRSESSNTPVEQQRGEYASLDFQKAFPGLSRPACGRQIQT